MNPLRDLFAKHNGNATALLVHLCMLEVRFGNSYLSELENDWTGPFKVEVPLYKELVVKGAWAAARMITKDDQLAFRLLSLSSIIDNDQHFRNVKRRWNDLCFAVQECATPQSGLRSCLLELAQVRLSPLSSVTPSHLTPVPAECSKLLCDNCGTTRSTTRLIR